MAVDTTCSTDAPDKAIRWLARAVKIAKTQATQVKIVLLIGFGSATGRPVDPGLLPMGVQKVGGASGGSTPNSLQTFRS